MLPLPPARWLCAPATSAISCSMCSFTRCGYARLYDSIAAAAQVGRGGGPGGRR